MKRIGEVLDALVAEGLISEDESNLKNQPESETPSPWFIQILMGLGGWIGAAFFFAFAFSCFFITLGFTGEFAIGMSFSVLGAVCLLVTTWHIHSAARPNVFATQFRLVVHIVGHIALIGGVMTGLQIWRFSYVEAIFGGLVVLQSVVFIALYPDGIFRFLAAIALVVGIHSILYDFAIMGSVSVLIGTLGLALFFFFCGLLPAKQELEHFELLQSMPYGLAFGFFGSILLEQYYGQQATWQVNLAGFHTPYLSSILILLLLLAFVIRLLKSYEIKLMAPSALFIITLIVLIALPTLNTSGILAGIFVSLIAYRRRNWILLALSYIFLAYFINYFYYTLNIGLDIKSYILMGTGLALLIARLIFKRIVPDLDNTEAA